MRTINKNMVVLHLSSQSTIGPLDAWNDREYVLPNQAAMQLFLPFSYKDIIDLPLVEHSLSIVFVAFTHSRHSYWVPNICHTLCRALGRWQCSKHYLSSRILELSEQTHKLSRYYHTVRCMLWITKVNNTYWTLATCQALSCALHMNDLFYLHPDPMRQALTFPSLCSWENRSMQTARSYCKRQNQTSNSGGVTPGTCSLNLSIMLLFYNITWRSVGGIHVWGIFGPRKAKK